MDDARVRREALRLRAQSLGSRERAELLAELDRQIAALDGGDGAAAQDGETG
jgi:hypothetical protein